ncbi:MAG: prepilin peptidase [Candidatus Eremiobacteraeota bacterium]|nr:prepilin peptidase [Candidatus Eremiobacteraeota bacterium]
MLFLAALVGALICVAAGTCGVLLAMAILPRLQRFEDGPAPQKVHPAALVAGAGVLGAVLAWHHVPPIEFLIAALTTIALVAVWYCDARTGIVPDVFTLVPLGLCVAYGLFNHEWLVPISAVVLFVPFGVAALLSHGRGMGWGDAKLAAFGGALLGMFVATLAFGVASLVAVIVSSIRYRAKPVPIAFAPYLVAAIAVSLAIQVR